MRVWKPERTNVVLFKPNDLVCLHKTLMKCLWHEGECNGFERVCYLFILQKHSGLVPCCWLLVERQFRLREPLFPWCWSLWSVQVGNDCPNKLLQLPGVLLPVPSALRRGQVSVACERPLLPPVSGCSSRQLLVGFINRPTKQHTSVSHLESLKRLHKNTSRACEVKLLCVCVLDKKERDMLNKKRGELASGMAGHRPAGGERLHWAPLVWCILLSLLLVFLPFLTY